MKMLLTVEIPHEPFNSLVSGGKAGEIMGRIAGSDQAGGGVLYRAGRNALRDIPDQRTKSIRRSHFCGAVLSQLPGQLQVPHCDEPGGFAKAGLDALGKKWA